MWIASLSAGKLRILTLLVFILCPLSISTARAAQAGSRSAEDFVGPATVKPLAGDSAKKGPVKPAPKPASAATAPTAATATPAGKPAPAPAPAGTAAAPAAKPAAKSPGRLVLDTAHIHAIYLDGDFDQAIKILDGALKSRKTLTHGDSVFIYKHLGVIYAATPATREKGRYYMLQLISIEPTAKILDMYASDMIYMVFDHVRLEFEAAQRRDAGIRTAHHPDSAAPKTTALRAGGNGTSHAWYWVGGAGVAAAAAGTGMFFYLHQDKRDPVVVKTEYEVH